MIINGILKNSVTIKLLAAFFLAFLRMWEGSAVYRMLSSLKTQYENSVSHRLWETFCSVPDTAAASFYGRVLGKLGLALEKFGDMVRQSIFYRAVSRIPLDLHQWFLAAFVLYLPLEYVVRGYLPVPILVSLWEEAFIAAAFVLILWRRALGCSAIPGRIDRNEQPALQAPWRSAIPGWIDRNEQPALQTPERSAMPGRTYRNEQPALQAPERSAMPGRIYRNEQPALRALRPGETLERVTSFDGYIILYMAAGLLLMSIVDPSPAVAFAGYRAAVEYMVWFFLLIRLIETEKDFKLVYYGFLIMGGLLCLHGIYQYIVAVPIPASWVSQTEMGVRTRVFSITGSPNIFGSLIVMLAPMAAAMIYYCKKVLWKLFFAAMTGMMCLCLLFTFSRGAWVGIVLAVVLFALYLDRRLLGVLAGAMALVLVQAPSITSRLTYLFTSDYAEASAIGGRALRWEVGRLLLTENNPWLGFGLGRFGGAVAMNNKVMIETEEFKYFYMDNYYLKTMVEMGYIGIFFFLLMLAGLVIWSLRAIYQSGPAYRAGLDPLVRAAGNPRVMAVGIFSGLMGVLAHCYFENIFEEPYMMAYFFGLAAMLMYLGFFAKSKPDCVTIEGLKKSPKIG